ncbi:MAG: ATP-binding protein, partial [Chloroflexi bacterium]
MSLNLRAVYESDALGILMICAAAWLRRAVDRDDGVKRILVVDEAWKALTHLEVSRWLQENWKLTRSTAVQCIAVVHRLSDLGAAGGRDSERVRLARGLLADSETKVIFRQDRAELALVRDLCQLNERETAVVA